MRIISGSHRGKRFFAPKNLPVRPTTDFAKEGLFNLLSHSIEFSSDHMLDLFCGTGNITYELISRGYKNVLSIDQSYGCIKFVRTILSKEFNIQKPNVICSEVFKFLDRTSMNFDFIFADPPYDFEHYDDLINKIHARLKKGGLFILEHNNEHNFKHMKSFIEGRKYGNVCFSFFKVAS